MQTAKQTVLFVGSGDLATRAASMLVAPSRCIGLCRHPDRLPDSIEGLAGDYTCSSAYEGLSQWAPDTIVLTLKPAGGRDTEAYRRGFLTPVQHMLAALGHHRPRRILFVSSTRVYTEAAGGWVDESAPVADDGSPAGMIVAAEQYLLGSGHPATILRCAGLYGGSGGVLLARIARGEISPAMPVHYGNRVHRDDAAGFIAWLIEREACSGVLHDCYNLVDDNPAPQHDVDQWLAATLSVSVGRALVEGALDGVPPPGSRGHKRVSNRRLRSSDYQLRYPDYRSGYAAVLNLYRERSLTC